MGRVRSSSASEIRIFLRHVYSVGAIAQSPRPVAARQEGSPKVPTQDLNAAPKNYAGIFAP
jgi:hypothetical protein